MPSYPFVASLRTKTFPALSRVETLPLEEFNERKGEVPTDRPVALVCNTGTRAYEAQIKLRNMGIRTVNSAGGFQALKKRGDDTKF